jgi:hypothetical protein
LGRASGNVLLDNQSQRQRNSKYTLPYDYV